LNYLRREINLFLVHQSKDERCRRFLTPSFFVWLIRFAIAVISSGYTLILIFSEDMGETTNVLRNGLLCSSNFRGKGLKFGRRLLLA